MATATRAFSALSGKTYQRGDLIVAAKPYAHIISMKANGQFCDWCAHPAPMLGRLFKCTSCQYEHYCNKACQRSAWKYHKFECTLLKSRQPKIPSDSARLFTRLVYNYIKKVRKPDDDPGWREFKDLCHHAQLLSKDLKRSKQFMELSFTLAAYVGEKNVRMLPSSRELMEIFGRMVFNGITIVQPGQEFGIGIYISPSIFNHSCTPNACFVNDGTTLMVRALCDINTSTDEIFVNYIDPMVPRIDRLTELKENYFFTCMCTKCVDDTEAERKFEATLCSFCGGYVTSDGAGLLQCFSCHKTITDQTYIDQRNMFEHSAASLAKKSVTDGDNKSELKTLIANSAKLVASCNARLHMLKANLYAEECQGNDLRTAYELGEELTVILQMHYPMYFPALGEHHLKQARLAWNINQLKDTAAHYTEALNILRVTHGVQHSLYKMAEKDLADCLKIDHTSV